MYRGNLVAHSESKSIGSESAVSAIAALEALVGRPSLIFVFDPRQDVFGRVIFKRGSGSIREITAGAQQVTGDVQVARAHEELACKIQFLNTEDPEARITHITALDQSGRSMP